MACETPVHGETFRDSFELNVTECPPKRRGVYCNQTCGCLQGAACDRWAGCECPSGWEGEHCELRCPDGTYGKGCVHKCDCENTKICHHVTGQCICVGRTGANCEEPCPWGKYGPGCERSCECRSNVSCDAMTGRCHCEQAGLAGEFCELEKSENDVYTVRNVIIALIIVLTFFAVCLARQTCWQRFKNHEFEFDEQLVTDDFEQRLLGWEKDPRMLDLAEMIGQGKFGHVLRGQLSNPDGSVLQVAAKTVHQNDAQAHRAFSHEMAIMITIQEGLENPVRCSNIVRLHGIITQSEPKYILLEYAERGDLLSALRQSRNGDARQNLWRLAVDVARALLYLQELKLVHRDVAARNVLISADGVGKLADFGLSRDIYTDSVYMHRDNPGQSNHLPLKWMALESLRDGEFTHKSDVWSYGVLLWEIATMGNEPVYPGPLRPDCHHLVNVLEEGHRLQLPRGCSMNMYRLMARCWSADHDRRPEPQDLIKTVQLYGNVQEESGTANLTCDLRDLESYDFFGIQVESVELELETLGCEKGKFGPLCDQDFVSEDGETFRDSFLLNVTECPPNRRGVYCNQTCGCLQGAACDRWAGCECPSGWEGEHCEARCLDGSYGKGCVHKCDCENTEICHHVTGQCICVGRTGANCEEPCPWGKYGPGCERSCECRSNVSCDAMTGRCHCEQAGLAGEFCEVEKSEGDVYTVRNVIIALSIVFTFFVVCLARQTCWQRLKKHEFEDDELVTGDFEQRLLGWEKDPRMLDLAEMIGQGKFGHVLRGQLSNSDGSVLQVAAKTVHQNDAQAHRAFCHEMAIMITIQEGLENPVRCSNIVRLHGIITQSEPKYILFEYAERGDLLSALRQSRNGDARQNFWRLAVNVARALLYLQELKLVHRDVAARNVLISADGVGKLADFGLSRDIYTDSVYTHRDNPGQANHLPLKWMALESLRDGEFTHKSDVWSYGVLLWEIATMGNEPVYPGPLRPDCHHLVNVLEEGHRLQLPRNCSMNMYRLMRRCWSADHDRRPEPQDLIKTVQLYGNVKEEWVEKETTQGDRRGVYCNKTCGCLQGAACDRWAGCECPSGWKGEHCELRCPDGTYGKGCVHKCDCENTKICHHVTGQCICVGRTGANCEEPCPWGKYGPGCERSCECRRNVSCDVMTGRCHCEQAGLAGEFCELEKSGGDVYTVRNVIIALSIVVTFFAVCLTKQTCWQRLKKHDFEDDELVTHDFNQRLLSWEKDPRMLDLAEMIGQGKFGHVLRGKLSNPDGSVLQVAAKTVHQNDSQAHRAFCHEMNVMVTIHEGLENPVRCSNIARLHGIITQSEPKYILFEYAERGDLLSALRQSRNGDACQNFWRLAMDVARALLFLQELKLVHRDVAARNVLISADGVGKLADFGLSRDIYTDSVYMHRDNPGQSNHLPLKWMALESLRDGEFTHKSDVWSYGVLLWEIATMGNEPVYPGPLRPDCHHLINVLEEGHRLQLPRGCSMNMYRLMGRCWSADHDRRPEPHNLIKSVQLYGNVKEEWAEKETTVDSSNRFAEVMVLAESKQFPHWTTEDYMPPAKVSPEVLPAWEAKPIARYFLFLYIPLSRTGTANLTCDLRNIESYDFFGIQVESVELELETVGCEEGKFGPLCDQDCRCKNGARCHGLNGACKCTPGWQGVACDIPKPTVAIKMSSKVPGNIAYIGSTVSLSCMTFHLNIIQVQWDFKSFLNRQNKTNILSRTNNTVINIGSVSPDNNGNYTCTVVSEDGETFRDSFVLNATECPPNRRGIYCNQTCDCLQGAACDRWTGCKCLSGWEGEHCDLRCPYGTYGKGCVHKCDCENTATCHHVTGQCVCVERTGANCEEPCPWGQYGPGCERSCECRSNVSCDVMTGRCHCEQAGLAGEFCELEKSGDNVYTVRNVIIALSILLTFFVVCLARQTCWQRLKKLEFEDDELITGDFEQRLLGWEKDPRMLDLAEMIGQGKFGHVLRGQLSNPDGSVLQVAANTVHQNDAQAHRAFSHEMAIMITIQEGLENPVRRSNIVRLHGIITQSEPKYILFEYAERGDLLSALRQSRNGDARQNFWRLAVDVARALLYLQELKLVHRDVAARNVLISADGVGKLADFGLSRDIYTDSVYMHRDNPGQSNQLPLKWMALESLRDGEFTHKSDVWSYGVLLWEIATMGNEPVYPGPLRPDCHHLVNVLEEGHRLQLPRGCSMNMYRLMVRCWSADHDWRPEPQDLIKSVQLYGNVQEWVEKETTV
ncbi:uncharacterized protein LOC118424944 [Branchiostoma floridae]|uniref:receptor protein-tyrosine kinase n=1 Tax=Branchiostoma floridae TaxID=7739 RepID=A0A9J7LW53_BRAFL|nr:uncharacterized protein LOC118424944 [Branchiostoma floridae]